MDKPTAIVVGVGAEQGVGGAVCRRFASEGYHVYVAGRTEAKIAKVVDTIAKAGGSAEAFTTDATKESEVVALFDRAFSAAGRAAPDLVVFNAGNNKRVEFRDVSAQSFEDFLRVGCFAGFLVGREAARHLVPLGWGTVLFTGASGSIRGKAAYGHFAAAKAGLRMISQSMAREFGPQGIHVAHAVKLVQSLRAWSFREGLSASSSCTVIWMWLGSTGDMFASFAMRRSSFQSVEPESSGKHVCQSL
jgi:NAD(P)-dependent dehydrogenase (short-subunit alcohol dehydrogenase family)